MAGFAACVGSRQGGRSGSGVRGRWTGSSRSGPVAGVLVAACLLSGCSHRPAAEVQPAPSTSVPVASSPATGPPSGGRSKPPVAEQVLAQYTVFWTVITPASRAPADRRRAILAPYTTDPELSRLLRGLAAAEAVGEGQYGAEVPRATVTSVRGDTAAVRDCQDASHAGKISLKTGKPITVGVPRNPVNATLRRGPDGRWRVSTVEFTGRTC